MRSQGGLKFSVEHYAGNVIYDANSFVSKNKDLLKPELQMVEHVSPCCIAFRMYHDNT